MTRVMSPGRIRPVDGYNSDGGNGTSDLQKNLRKLAREQIQRQKRQKEREVLLMKKLDETHEDQLQKIIEAKEKAQEEKKRRL